jgi:hypothetical protein
MPGTRPGMTVERFVAGMTVERRRRITRRGRA